MAVVAGTTAFFLGNQPSTNAEPLVDPTRSSSPPRPIPARTVIEPGYLAMREGAG